MKALPAVEGVDTRRIRDVDFLAGHGGDGLGVAAFGHPKSYDVEQCLLYAGLKFPKIVDLAIAKQTLRMEIDNNLHRIVAEQGIDQGHIDLRAGPKVVTQLFLPYLISGIFLMKV